MAYSDRSLEGVVGIGGHRPFESLDGCRLYRRLARVGRDHAHDEFESRKNIYQPQFA